MPAVSSEGIKELPSLMTRIDAMGLSEEYAAPRA